MKEILTTPDKPGVNGVPFKIVLSNKWFDKDDVINTIFIMDGDIKVEYTLWRKFLIWLGFKPKPSQYIFEARPKSHRNFKGFDRNYWI